MEIFEAFDLTGTAWSAAQLTGCDAKTVARYVALGEERLAGDDQTVRFGSVRYSTPLGQAGTRGVVPGRRP